MFQGKFLTHNTHCLLSECSSTNGQHPRAKLPNLQGTLSKDIPWSRHCFADSCELKQMAVWRCVLDKPGLYATPIV